MDKYFQVYNDRNDLIIDDTFKLLRLKRKIKLTDLSLKKSFPTAFLGLSENKYRDGTHEEYRLYQLVLEKGEMLVGVGGKCFPYQVHVGTQISDVNADAYFNLATPYETFKFCAATCDIYKVYDDPLLYSDTENYTIGVTCDNTGVIFAGANYFLSSNGPWEKIEVCNCSDIYVYIFGYDDDSIPSKHGEGVQFISGDGKPIYDSAKKYLRVLRTETIKNPPASDLNGLTGVEWRKDEIAIFPLQYHVLSHTADFFGSTIKYFEDFGTSMGIYPIIRFKGEDIWNDANIAGADPTICCQVKFSSFNHLGSQISFGKSTEYVVGAGFSAIVTGY